MCSIWEQGQVPGSARITLGPALPSACLLGAPCWPVFTLHVALSYVACRFPIRAQDCFSPGKTSFPISCLSSRMN